MLKLGKPKASFNKAIKEIDEYMKDPSVSFANLLTDSPNLTFFVVFF